VYHVHFLWVGAEEAGLLGSNFYVASLSSAERANIIAMPDFDVVASPNYARQGYGGDGSTFGANVSGPNQSGFIESLFNGWFDSQGLAHEPMIAEGPTPRFAPGVPSELWDDLRCERFFPTDAPMRQSRCR